jgi:hypothetical protein
MLQFNLHAQQKIGIKGAILDSIDKIEISNSTIAILSARDSSLISFTLSDEKGRFELRNIQLSGILTLLISHVGYRTEKIDLPISSKSIIDLGEIKLKRIQLAEVLINGIISPVVIKKDTIEFNAVAFKVKPNALLEELLRKMPGLQVNQDGTIIVNGKIISRVLVEGKSFFGDDVKLATKNLDADIISKIQIYDDRSFDAYQQTPEYLIPKVMNLKLKKKSLKTAFGKAYGGGGTKERFEAGGLYNLFRDTLQVSLIGAANNLDKSAFSQEDLGRLGGFDRGGSDAIYNGALSLGGNSSGGIETIYSAGANVNSDFSRNVKLNLQYFYSQVKDKYETNSYQQQFIADSSFNDHSSTSRIQLQGKHTINSTIEVNAGKFGFFKYNPQIQFQQTNSRIINNTTLSSTHNPIIAIINNLSNTNSSQNRFRHFLNASIPLTSKKGLSIGHYLIYEPNISKTIIFGELITPLNNSTNSIIEKQSKDGVSRFATNFSLGYGFNILKSIQVNMNYAGNFSRETNSVVVYDKDPISDEYHIFVSDLSNELQRNQLLQKFKSQLNLATTKNQSLGFAGEFIVLHNNNKFLKLGHNTTELYSTFMPSLTYNFGKLNFGFETTLLTPSITDIQPLKIINSPRYVFNGNPELTFGKKYNLNISYYKYRVKSGSFFSFQVRGYLENNSVIRSREIESDGTEVITPVNISGNKGSNISLSTGKNFKKQGDWKISSNIYLNGSSNINMLLINKLNIRQRLSSGSVSVSVPFNWNDKIDISPSYMLSRSAAKYDAGEIDDISYFTHVLRTPFQFNVSDDLVFEGNYEYTFNPMVSLEFKKSFHLLNFAISHRIQKNSKGLIKLSCYDFLNQNVSLFRFVNQNSITDYENTILKRYLMLTYMYRFSKK